MLECLILGDSIAVGIAQQRPECVADARVGRASPAQRLHRERARVVIVSLGSNDGRAVPTARHLRRLRAALRTGHVIWVVPALPAAARTVREVARHYGDATVSVAPVVGPDGVHPSGIGYERLAVATRRGGERTLRYAQATTRRTTR